MTLHAIVFNYLIVAPHALLAVVLAVLIHRRLLQEFPAFSLYVVSELVQFFVLFTLLRLPNVSVQTYAAGFSVGLTVSTVLRFAVLYEVTAYVLRNYTAAAGVGRVAFRWAVVGVSLLSLLLAIYTESSNLSRMMSVVYTLDRTASIVQCGLLLMLFGFSSYLNLSWRSRVFGIALGLGVFASVELASAAILLHVGRAYSTYLNYLTLLTYHACVLVWIYYLWVPERAPVQSRQKFPEQDLEAWNRELQRLIQP